MKNILKLVAIVAVVLVGVNTVDAKTLSVGSTGPEVSALQTWLINNGYPIPFIEQGVASKGYFGVQTSNAVKMYQESNEQNPTGVIDSESYGQVKLGVASGPDLYNQITFYKGALFSSTFATTSTGAGTLTYGNIDTVTTILSTNAGALTLTMPASTTLRAFVPKAGDRAQLLIVNQGTALLTLAGGTGTLLQTSSTTKTVNIGGSALLNFVRKTNTDIIVNMTPAI